MKKRIALMLAMAMLVSVAALAEEAPAGDAVTKESLTQDVLNEFSSAFDALSGGIVSDLTSSQSAPTATEAAPGEPAATEAPEEEDRTAQYVGTWYLNEVVMEGAGVSPTALGMEMSMELRKNGAAFGTTVEGEKTMRNTGVWFVEEGGVSVKLDEVAAHFAMTDGNLSGEVDGMTMVFGRDKLTGDLFSPAAIKSDATLADYAGQWTAFKINVNGVYMDTSLLGEAITADIEETTMTLKGFLFNSDALEMTFANGALSFFAEGVDNVLIASVSARLLEDDTLVVTLTATESMSLIMSRAESAQ